MQNFGEKWADEVKRYSGNGWWSDLSSLSVVLYKCKISPYILPQTWNFRAYMDREFPNGEFHSNHGFGPIKIWHLRTPVPAGFIARRHWFWKLRSTWYYRLRAVLGVFKR